MPSHTISPELKRPIAAIALGLAGLALNRLDVALLTEETPTFLFGGIPALAAFVFLGPRLGVLSGVVTLSALLSKGSLEGFATVVYLLEWGATAWIFTRTGSLVLSACLFWVGPGVLFDAFVYWRGLELPAAYVGLLYVKQIYNAVLNAIVVEILLYALPRLARRRWRAPVETPLRRLAFSRILMVVVVPLAVVGVLYTKSAYGREVNEARLRNQRVAIDIRLAVRQFLQIHDSELIWIARELELRLAREAAPDPTVLDRLHADHPDFLNVGVTNVDGDVIAMSPSINVRGESTVIGSVRSRSYFRGARESTATVYAPLILGKLQMQQAVGTEPVVIMARALRLYDGRFAGVVFAAIHARVLGALLAGPSRLPAQVVTLLDNEEHVIASQSPTLSPGMPFSDTLHAIVSRVEAGTDFEYYPSVPSDDRERRRRLDLHYASYQRVAPANFGLVVDVPSSSLHESFKRTVAATVLLIALALGAISFGVRELAKNITDPLRGVGRMLNDLARGELDGALGPLRDSHIAELRAVAGDTAQLQTALQERRQLVAAERDELRRRFEATFEHAPVGLAHVSVEGRLTIVNAALGRMSDRPAEALVGTLALDYVHAEDRTMARGVFRRTLTRRSTEIAMLRVRGADDRWLEAQVTASAVCDQAGTPRYVILVVEDHTERRLLEAQLRQSSKMESIGRLAGGVAHDFNNLMTAVLGYAEFVLNELPADDPLRDDVMQIQDAGQRAARLTRQLLAFARKQMIEPRTIWLSTLTRELESMLRRLIGENIDLQVLSPQERWPVRVDASQIEQVVVNLVVNARDATLSGGRITVCVDNQTLVPADARPLGLAEGDYVHLSVYDTGAGMSDDVRAHVFEPFYTTKTAVGGTGLGLPTCYAIVIRSGGAIRVDSTVGAGTTVHVWLPRSAEDEVERDAASASSAPNGRATILLVEDEERLATIGARALRNEGYEVLQASDGVAGLEVARAFRGRIDLLVTDVLMPRMNGVELAERLAGERPTMRVLFTTGYAPEALDVRLNADARILTKPFSGSVLAQAVRHALVSPAARADDGGATIPA